MKRKLVWLVLLVSGINFHHLDAQLTPDEAIKQMTRGINIGNTFDAIPTETSWGNPQIQEFYFDDYKNAGFNSIRIPITWKFHVLKSSPYTIDKTWLDRVDSVITWGLKRDLVIIINAHHEDWLKNNPTNPDTLARFDSIWSQVSRHFNNKSEKLLFEILNEPNPMPQTNLDLLNTRILSIIRKMNPTRLVIFSGYQWSNSDQLLAAKIPDLTDKYLIGNYHSYDPWNFAGQALVTYGSSSDINGTISKFNQVVGWSVNKQIPVILGEFGAEKQCEYNSRMLYYATVVDQALAHHVPFFAWDDGGNFQTYLRYSRTWNDLKDILTHTYNQSPNQLSVNVDNKGKLKLSWINRTTANDSIYIDRKTIYSSFSKIGAVSNTAAQFIDSSITIKDTYYYRLRTSIRDSINPYSYPISTYVNATVTSISNTYESQNEFTLFPNPANEFITLQHLYGGVASVEIFNSMGIKVYSESLLNETNQISLANMPNGVYMLICRSKYSVATEKITIQHY